MGSKGQLEGQIGNVSNEFIKNSAKKDNGGKQEDIVGPGRGKCNYEFCIRVRKA